MTLVVLVALPPLALSTFVGWPLPSHVSLDAIGDAFNGATISDAVLINGLACVCWLAWMLVVVSAVIEIGAWIQGRAAAHVPAAGLVQPLVRQLVISATVLVGAMRSSAPSPPPARATASPTLAVYTQAEPAPPKLDESVITAPTYVVVPRDSLWRIAERHLGDGLRWHELWELNRGQTQPDGRTMLDPNLIRPGWALTMPADATGLSPPEATSPPASAPPVTLPDAPEPPLPTPSTSTTRTTTTPTSVHVAASPRASNHDDGDHFPVPLVLTGGTLMAAGVVKALNDLRRRQLEERMPGHSIPIPTSKAATAERLMRAAADVDGAERLDVALRVLGAQLALADDPDVRIEAACVDEGTIEILLTRSVEAPSGPFEVVDGRAWTLPSDVSLGDLVPLAAARGCLAPGLVTIGHRDEQQLLIDLEADSPLVLECDDETARSFLASVALDCATHAWADDVRVIFAPEAPAASALDRVEVVPTVDEAIEQASADAALVREALAEGGISSTWMGRIANSGDGWSPTVVALLPSIDASERHRAVAELAGLPGVGVVAPLPPEFAACYECRVIIRDGEATLLPLDYSFAPAGVPGELAESMDEAIEVALSNEAGEPLSVSTTSDGVDLTDGALGFEPTVALSDGRSKVLVRVLGRVEIEGTRNPIERRRAKELVVLLALHPHGLNEAQIKNALWLDEMPTTNAFNQAMSRARRSLGTDDSGELYIPYVFDGVYRPGPSLMTDWRLLESAWERATRDPSAENIARLSSTLDEVRGLPFEGTRGYEWAYEEGLPHRMSAVIDEARRLLVEARVAG